ncbi:MAG TPA: hypothetical protein VF645_04360 [Allosphingosinicella sp.]|jgi:hypothetical protein
MSHFAPRAATILLALALTLSGVILGAAGSGPTLPHPIAPFGCFT